jgi:hypothetical protein
MIVAVVLGPWLGALVSFFAHPVLSQLKTAIDAFAKMIAGALAEFQDGLSSVAGFTHNAMMSSAREAVEPDQGTNWPWRAVIRPLLSLATFVYLSLVDLYLAALASAAFFDSPYVPNLHLPLPLMMGLLWPGVALAWSEGLTDIVGDRPRSPYAGMPRRYRKLLGALVGLGVVAALAGNILFFLWRQGQLATHNPFAGAQWWIAGVIGALLFGGLALSAVGGLRILALLVPLGLGVAFLLLKFCIGAIWGLRATLELFEIASTAFLEILIELGRHFEQVARAVSLALVSVLNFVRVSLENRAADALERRRLAAERRAAPRRRHRARTEPSGVGIASATVVGPPSAGLFERVLFGAGRAVRDIVAAVGHAVRWSANTVVAAAVAVWRAAGIAIFTIASVCAASVRYLLRAVERLLRGVEGAIRGIARGTAVASCAVMPPAGSGIAYVVVSCVKALTAVALWFWFLVPRICWPVFNWLCRFEFMTRTLKFRPLPDPPPRERLAAHLRHLSLYPKQPATVHAHPAFVAPAAHASADRVPPAASAEGGA